MSFIMGDWNTQRGDLERIFENFNVSNIGLKWSVGKGETFRSMITKEFKEIDFIISDEAFETRTADDYSPWTWNYSDHKPIEASLSFEERK